MGDPNPDFLVQAIAGADVELVRELLDEDFSPNEIGLGMAPLWASILRMLNYKFKDDLLYQRCLQIFHIIYDHPDVIIPNRNFSNRNMLRYMT